MTTKGNVLASLSIALIMAALTKSGLSHDFSFYLFFPGYIIAFIAFGGIHGQTMQALLLRSSCFNFGFYGIVSYLILWRIPTRHHNKLASTDQQLCAKQ